MNWYYVATICYGLADLLFVELVVSIFFKVKRKGTVKLLIDFGMRNSRKMTMYALFFVLFGSLFFIASNLFQETVVSVFLLLGWRLVFLFFALLSFDIFWVSRMISTRRKRSDVYKTSIVVLLLSLLLWGLSYIIDLVKIIPF